LPDAILGASADLRVPRFGDYAAVINFNRTGRNANVLTQQTVIQSGDVDSLDNEIHLRFAFVPVLDDAGHTAESQPYFFIAVRNVTRGNALLYEAFAYANQPGIPWKTFNHSNGRTYRYTDWQVVDIAPGSASIAVGDTIVLEAIGAGCSQSGHAGWVYVDAFGSYIPGPSVIATAPSLVNAGARSPTTSPRATRERPGSGPRSSSSPCPRRRPSAPCRTRPTAVSRLASSPATSAR
jgi:hypothetical protein